MKGAYHDGATKVSLNHTEMKDWAYIRKVKKPYDDKSISKEEVIRQAKEYADGLTGEPLSPEDAARRRMYLSDPAEYYD